MSAKTVVSIVALATFLCSCQQASGGREGDPSGPACVAGFCFDVDSIGELMKESELVKKYGPGFQENKKFPLHCYELRDQGLFIRIRPYHGEDKQIMEVFVSDVPNCPSSLPPTQPFPRATTGEGLAVGESVDKLLGLYGKPAMQGTAVKLGYCQRGNAVTTKKCPYGDLVYRYLRKGDQLFRADILLRSSRVTGILISIYP
jgi:hypothetical protein